MKTSESELLKVLGLMWDEFEDTLFCEAQNIDMTDLLVTRQNVLSIT